jgi:hypothetical protein
MSILIGVLLIDFLLPATTEENIQLLVMSLLVKLLLLLLLFVVSMIIIEGLELDWALLLLVLMAQTDKNRIVS